MNKLDAVLDDLAAESAQLDGWVAGLTPDQWGTVTTPEGWTVAHQVAHLHWTDVTSTYAISDKEAFDALIVAALENPEGYVDEATDELAQEPPESLLPAWRQGRTNLVEALQSVPEGNRIPWFGPPMSPVSMATARLMETWAHGHDVAEALDISVPRTDRAKHVCHIGVRTFGFTHQMRGEEVPAVEVRVELTAPSGELWTWGPEDAAERVIGDGWDFALLATRRRHRSDVDVTATGPAADHWLDIVQAFAGLPGNDPKPLADR
ncbi:TIGR03084 family metal-binding protein [Aeromicrobium sp. JJY06]|uniref:TIGR03084 family metal-binding protein n=1 Tax=Aeromicrobium sp. JJY06 TaxID=3373478 RepID=UPI00376F22F4